MKYFLLCFYTLTTLSHLAEASPELKKAITDTASSIQLKIFESQASDEQLTEALRLLNASLEIISSENNGLNQACVEWAYPLYYQSQSASEAQANATKSCRGQVDLEVAKWLYPKFYQSQSAANSVDHATAGSKRAQGKLPIIQYAYDKYYLSLNSAEAATRSATGAQQVLPSAKACLERAYAIHYQSHSASEAMDLAFLDCRP